MGLTLSRRHDFLTYEKSLEKITRESGTLLVRRNKRKAYLNGYRNQLLKVCIISLVPCVAWVAYLRQQPADYHSLVKYFLMTAAPFIVPLLTYISATVIMWLMQIVEKGEAKQLKKYDDAKKKLIKELKDSTNFEKTMALLKKYDPEVHVPPPGTSPAGRPKHGKAGQAGPGQAAAAAGSRGAASSILGTALDSVGSFATKFMGDNPTLVEELRRAQAAGMCLRQENDMLRQHLLELCRKYDETPVFLSVNNLPQQQQQPLLQLEAPPATPSCASDASAGEASAGGKTSGNGNAQQPAGGSGAGEAKSKAAAAPRSSWSGDDEWSGREGDNKENSGSDGGLGGNKDAAAAGAQGGKELPGSCAVEAKGGAAADRKVEAKAGRKQTVK